jgi:hypothetical protein
MMHNIWTKMFLIYECIVCEFDKNRSVKKNYTDGTTCCAASKATSQPHMLMPPIASYKIMWQLIPPDCKRERQLCTTIAKKIKIKIQTSLLLEEQHNVIFLKRNVIKFTTQCSI